MDAEFTDFEMADELRKLVMSKQTWIHDFSSGRHKRTDHEIEIRRRELHVLRQAETHFLNRARSQAA